MFCYHIQHTRVIRAFCMKDCHTLRYFTMHLYCSYDTMKQCWSPEEKFRPLFEEVVANMQMIITNMEHSYNEYVSTNITYINIVSSSSSSEQLSEAAAYPGHPVKHFLHPENLLTHSVDHVHSRGDSSAESQGYLCPNTCSTYTCEDGTQSTLV